MRRTIYQLGFYLLHNRIVFAREKAKCIYSICVVYFKKINRYFFCAANYFYLLLYTLSPI